MVGCEVWAGCTKEGHITRQITRRKDTKREWVAFRDLRVVVWGYKAVGTMVAGCKTACWRGILPFDARMRCINFLCW